MKTPYDFGARGDGVADDTVPVQNWLNAIAGECGYGAAGHFAVSGMMKVHSGTTILGAGAGGFFIEKHPSFPADVILLQNARFSFPPSAPLERDIRVMGTCFKGLPTQVTDKDMVAYVGVTNLTMSGCRFTGNRLKLLAGSNMINANIEGNEFDDFGKIGAPPNPGTCTYEGGPAIWFGWEDKGIRIANNWIHDGHWSGILLTADGCDVSGNRIERVKEAAIYGAPTHSVIGGNRVSDVVLKDCAAHGIELDSGAHDVVVSGNVINDTGFCSIAATNPREVVISGNVCSSPGRQGTASNMSSCIAIYNGGQAVAPRNVTVATNILTSNGAYFGVSLVDINNGMPMDNMSILGNNLGLKADWKTTPIFLSPTARGVNYLERDNNF